MSDKLKLKIIKLCDDQATREKGLMDFRKLKNDECAFFIFPTASSHPFWNKNVSYSLSLACINEKFEIECFLDLERESSNPKYPEKRNIRYVIETNDGILEESGIEKGDRVDFDSEEGTLIIESPEKKYKGKYKE